MATLYVRDFPEDLHDQLKARAKRNRRSVSAEITAMVKRGLQEDDLTRERIEALKDLDELRKAWALPPGAVDTAVLIREDRDR